MSRTSRQTADARSTILVHHHELLREGLVRILEAAGFCVIAQASEGPSIRLMAVENQPQLILMEWDAPGVDASFVGDLVESTGDSAIVVMTRPDSQEDLSGVLAAGTRGCLSVNLSADDFIASLDVLMRGDILVSYEMSEAIREHRADAGETSTPLTPREMEVLKLVGQGASNREIAQSLFISEHTAKVHLRKLLAKLELRNRQQAAAFAVREGFLE